MICMRMRHRINRPFPDDYLGAQGDKIARGHVEADKRDAEGNAMECPEITTNDILKSMYAQYKVEENGDKVTQLTTNVTSE